MNPSMNIQVLLVVMPCWLVGSYHRLKGSHCLYLQG